MLYLLEINDTGEASRVIGVFDAKHIRQAIKDAKVKYEDDLGWGCKLSVTRLPLNKSLSVNELMSARVY